MPAVTTSISLILNYLDRHTNRKNAPEVKTIAALIEIVGTEGCRSGSVSRAIHYVRGNLG
jgi:hypothetical protein